MVHARAAAPCAHLLSLLLLALTGSVAEEYYSEYSFVAKWRGVHAEAEHPDVGLCTAELIAPRWIITAAHCAIRKFRNETDYVHIELPNAATPNLRRDVAQEGCLHAPGGVDVALCRLTENVPADQTPPVPLNNALYYTGGVRPPAEGVMCVGTYGGLHATGPKKLITEASGEKLYVDNTEGSGMHAGDSGGAWLMQHNDTGVAGSWALTAVIHGGVSEGGHRRGVAAQVSYIRQWINSTTDGTVQWTEL